MFGFKKELYTPEYQLAGDECAVIETSKGTIKVKFDGEGAPIHVANFCELSTMGFYDGLKFHRYVPGFVIQGGDPNTRDMSGADVAAGLEGPDGMPGTGGPGYCIKGEFATNRVTATSTARLHGTFHGSRFRRFAVLLLPGCPAQPRLRLYRLWHHGRGPRRHLAAACR